MKCISGVEGFYGELATDDELTRQVDIVKGACHPYITIGMTRHLTEETSGEVVHEVDISAVGMDGEVDGLMDGGDEAVDEGVDTRPVFGNGIDVDLLVLGVPFNIGKERAHTTFLELEVVDTQVGRCGELVEEGVTFGLTGGLAAEFNGMEVDEVEDIADFHLVKIDGEGVVSFFGGDTIDEDVLTTTSHQEVVDQQTVLMIDDVGGLHIPCTLMENDVGRQDAQMGLGFVIQVVIELDDAVHLSADPFLLTVVVPG